MRLTCRIRWIQLQRGRGRVLLKPSKNGSTCTDSRKSTIVAADKENIEYTCTCDIRTHPLPEGSSSYSVAGSRTIIVVLSAFNWVAATQPVSTTGRKPTLNAHKPYGATPSQDEPRIEGGDTAHARARCTRGHPAHFGHRQADVPVCDRRTKARTEIAGRVLVDEAEAQAMEGSRLWHCRCGANVGDGVCV